MTKANADQVTYAHAKGARAAARKQTFADAVEGLDFELVQVGERFAFNLLAVKVEAPKVITKPTAKEVAAFPTVAKAKKIDLVPATDDAAKDSENGPEALGPNFTNLGHLPTETVTEEPNKAANAFGAFATSQLGATPTPTGANGKPAPKPAVVKPAKLPAEIKNGVRRPTAGTVCRAVWDELDKMVNPDSKSVKALADSKQWNSNNASIEFYQWRKFHGITGRSKAVAATEDKVA